MYYEARINARVDEKWDFEGTLTVYPPAGVRGETKIGCVYEMVEERKHETD